MASDAADGIGAAAVVAAVDVALAVVVGGAVVSVAAAAVVAADFAVVGIGEIDGTDVMAIVVGDVVGQIAEG